MSISRSVYEDVYKALYKDVYKVYILQSISIFKRNVYEDICKAMITSIKISKRICCIWSLAVL